MGADPPPPPPPPPPAAAARPIAAIPIKPHHNHSSQLRVDDCRVIYLPNVESSF